MTTKTSRAILREIFRKLPAFGESLEAHRQGWAMTHDQLVDQLRRCIAIVESGEDEERDYVLVDRSELEDR